MKLVKLSVIFEVFKVCFSVISVFTEVFLAMFQLPRKAKEAFHGQLTRFKFEELIHMREIGMFIF